MNKTILNFLATLLLAVLLSMFLPWWSVMLAALITAYVFPLENSAVFWTPFLSVGLYWSIYSFLLSSTNDYILAQKIASLFPLNGNPYLLILATGTLGGIAAGAGGVLGRQLVVVLKTKNAN